MSIISYQKKDGKVTVEFTKRADLLSFIQKCIPQLGRKRKYLPLLIFDEKEFNEHIEPLISKR